MFNRSLKYLLVPSGLTLDGSTKEKTWEGQCVLNNLEATTTTHTLSIRQVRIAGLFCAEFNFGNVLFS